MDTTAMIESTLRLAAFAATGQGGNPAGVWIGDAFPADSTMLEVARRIGFSETVFAATTGDGEARVRYFSPVDEIGFCGHATIALASALLGAAPKPASLSLQTRAGRIDIRHQDRMFWFSTVEQTVETVPQPWLDAVLGVFGWTSADLDPRFPPKLAFAGNWHLVLALARAADLDAMHYDLAALIPLARQHDIATLQLVHALSNSSFLSRNPFPAGHIYEDPATGAAAAAFAGYLKSLHAYPASGELELLQGDAMGIPCRLYVRTDDAGRTWVGGSTRPL